MAVNETTERIVWEGVDRLTGVTDKAASSVKGMRQSLDFAKSSLAALGVTVGAGALAALYFDALKAQGALDDMAESTGASVESLSAIQRVAKVGGQDFDSLTSGIGRMIKGLRESSDEGGRTARALELIGVQARGADEQIRDTGQIIIEVAQKLAQYRDGANKVALVQDILGKGAERFIPLLKDIAEGTDLVTKTTAKEAAAAEEAEKQIRRLTLAFEDARKETINEFLPAITKLVEQMSAGMKIAGGFGNAMLLFGTINPFKSVGENLTQYRADLESLKTARDQFSGMQGYEGQVANIDRQIESTSKRIEFLKLMQRQEAMDLAGPGSLDARDMRARQPTGGDAPLPGGSTATITPEQIAKQWEEAREEEHKVLSEAAALTAKFRANEQEQMRKFRALDLQETDEYYAAGGLVANEEKRIRQLILNAEAEENLAYETGQRILEADGTAHSIKLEQFRQSLLTTEEAENEAFQRRLEELRRFSDEELEILGGYDAVKERLNAEHQARVNQLSNKGNKTVFAFVDAARKGDIQSATGHFAALTAGFAQHSRKMFELNKIAAIADATVSMAAGISKSLSAYPMPWAAVAAAAHAALFVVQLSAIRNAKFGDGGAAPSLVGSAGMPVTPVESPGIAGGGGGPKEVRLIINGEGAAGRLIAEDLGRQLLELKRDGGFPDLFSAEVA